MSFYKKVDYNNNKECFDFLINHFTYPTLNSWNGLRSIANNVKIYNLEDIDDSDALRALEEDDYFSINQTIKDWEDDHPGYKVGFNGRSGGYLVLYNNHNNSHCFDGDSCNPCEYDDYQDWKEDVQDFWGSLKAYHSTLVDKVKTVQEFDKLCDDLVDVLRGLILDMHQRDARTKSYKATLRFQRYYYDTLEDLKLHMLDMKRRGYTLYDRDEDDLWAEYEMNEAISSEIVLEEGEII